MGDVGNADCLPHELAGRGGRGRVGSSGRHHARAKVGLKLGLGIDQLLDGHTLPQLVQGQDGLDS